MTDRFRLAAFVCASMVAALCPPVWADGGDAHFSLSWKLIDNLPENRYQAELTFTNGSPVPLAGNWALYFNSASRISPASVSPDFQLEHVNGDFYVLRPSAESRPVIRGERRVIHWEGAPWAINVSDAPSGFYLVREDESGRAEPIPIPIQIESFSTAKHVRRGGGDAWSAVSAESRFRDNEALELLPIDRVTPLVPTPAEWEALPGQVTIRPTTTIVYESALEEEADFLAASLEPLLGARLATLRSPKTPPVASDTIRLRLADEVVVDASANQEMDESYRLTIEPDSGIEIIGADSAGVFYGVQTLRALLPPTAYRRPAKEIAIKATRIVDAPRFGYRGVHLDVARNFQSKETVKKLLDLMAFYKLNQFHWHLTDDEGWRIEIRALPELTAVGARRGHTLDERDRLLPSQGSGPFADSASSAGSGFYTQEDFIEILRYAHRRHIVVIPELDLPGHARAAIKSMEARSRRLVAQNQAAAADEFLLTEPGDKSQYESVQMWRGNVVDVGREATYRFLDVVVCELVAIYDHAGVELKTVHLGGDEVPDGAWEKSPACKEIKVDADSSISRHGQLELYFLRRTRDILARHGIQAACWEDCVLLALGNRAKATDNDLADGNLPLLVYVWNNVWGWGREDAAYRLANAGFDVVLCNATHLYFDLAYEKDPQELGYYWAGFVSAREPYELIPLDVFKNVHQNTMGQPVDVSSFVDRVRLSKQGKRHILGIQGQLWGENLRSQQSLEYMAFPKLVTLAERAWAQDPDWSLTDDPQRRGEQLAHEWNEFANRLGQRELPRLDYLSGGVAYRIPPPGAVIRGGMLHANVAYPGLNIRYTKDGTEPTASSKLYQNPVPSNRDLKLKSFDARGRGSRTVTVKLPEADLQNPRTR